MYKLFLCLRYLRSRMIAYFAALGVALCVAMMLIAVSVMTGFLNKIEVAAKGLFGDVIVDGGGEGGLAYYDEFIRQVEQEVPQVEAGSPFILAYGLLAVPGTGHRQTIQVAGIRLPERAAVTDFEDGLFVQAGLDAPTFDPPISVMIRHVKEDAQRIEEILAAAERASPQQLELPELRRRLTNAIWYHISASEALNRAAPYQERLRQLQGKIDAAQAQLYTPTGESFEAKEHRLDQLREMLVGPGQMEEQAGFAGPRDRIILGLGLQSLSWTTPDGQTIRLMLPGHKVTLLLLPLGSQDLGLMGFTPVSRAFTIIDDCRTDVSSIDSRFVYVPFDTLQQLNNMGAEYSAEQTPQVVVPPRCGQIHFKVRNEFSEGLALQKVSAKVQAVWEDFRRRNPQAAGGEVYVQTWRERQADIISNIDRQRTLVFIMFAIISLVSVVLIFVIFYMIVFQKTKDIGVLKAVGASSGGVAQIFLAWGASVGLVGAAAGTALGYAFVRNINPIQDWVDDTFGYRVWSKKYFLFAEIPNEVDWNAAVFIIIGAVLAGLVGAMLPALRAAYMQPVEALRYE